MIEKIAQIFNDAGYGNDPMLLTKIKENVKLTKLISKLVPEDRNDFFEYVASILTEDANNWESFIRDLKRNRRPLGQIYNGHFDTEEKIAVAKAKLVSTEVNKIMRWFDLTMLNKTRRVRVRSTNSINKM